jgi:hypothetical protein
VPLVRTDVSEERIASIIRDKRVRELGILAVISNYNIIPTSLILFPLMIDGIHFSETSVLTRATRRHMPEDSILPSHRCENLKYYIELIGWAL